MEAAGKMPVTDAISKTRRDAVTGLASDCSSQAFSTPHGICITEPPNYAFVTNYVDDAVVRCSVNPTNGALEGCANAVRFQCPAFLALIYGQNAQSPPPYNTPHIADHDRP